MQIESLQIKKHVDLLHPFRPIKVTGDMVVLLHREDKCPKKFTINQFCFSLIDIKDYLGTEERRLFYDFEFTGDFAPDTDLVRQAFLESPTVPNIEWLDRDPETLGRRY